MVNNTLKGDYFYNHVLPLIDYSGDIRGGKTTYSADFSPNNIKTLIIAPEKAVVMYHIAVKGRKSNSVNLNPELVARCTRLEDYKPVMSVLYADRVCASIEEVIILNHHGVFTSAELDFENMIKGYGSIKGDIKETIMQRYKRLRAFVVVNDVDYEAFRTAMAQSDTSNGFFNTDFVKSRGNIIQFNTSPDWYKGYGSAAGFYALDRDGGALNTHFKQLIQRYESKKKADAIAQVKEERVKGVKEKFEAEQKKYKGIGKCVKMLKTFVSTQKSVLVPNTQILSLQDAEVFEPKSKEDYVMAVEKMKFYEMSIYSSLVAELVNFINSQSDEVKFALCCVCNGEWRNIPNVGIVPSKLGGKTLGSDSCGFEKAVRCVCADIVTVFVRKTDGKSVSKYCSEDGWREVI